MAAKIVQSVERHIMGWTNRGLKPRGSEISGPIQTGPEAHPAPCTMGKGSLSRR
jgi:hypothetical protein